MGIKLWNLSIHFHTNELERLLKMVEDGVEQEVSRRYEALEKFENTPIEPGCSEEWAFLQMDGLSDDFLTAAIHYRLWAYGGILVAVMSWLCDELLERLDFRRHSGYKLFMARLGEAVDVKNEPFLRELIATQDLEADLKERLLLWNDLRNRYVHSFGIVADSEKRKKITLQLGIEFDNDCRMQLTADVCRSLLRDAQTAAFEIIGKIEGKPQ